MKLKLSIFATIATLSACSSMQSEPNRRFTAAAKPETITILATTDFHGELIGVEGATGDGQKAVIGGAPFYASYIRILRETNPHPVVWIDAGDNFQGSMESNKFEGKPVVKLFNHLGLDASALGNHEFDYGPAGPKSVPREAGDDPRGALKARIQEARYPFLAANVLENGRTPSWLKKSVVLEKFGVRIGVVGGASPGTPGTTNALNLPGLEFKPLLNAVKEEAERLKREEKVDLVVLTVHDGGSCNDNDPRKQDDDSSCDQKEMLELADKLPEGLVSVIVSGHSHRGVAKRAQKTGTVVIQSFSHGKYIGWVHVNVRTGKAEVAGLEPVCEKVWDTSRGKTCDPFQLKFAKGGPQPATFLGKPITADRAVVDLLEPDLRKVRELKESPLGFTAVDAINRDFKKESALGNLMADVTRESYEGVEIGLANGGGLRANINPGPVTYGDVFGVLPFDNQLALMQVTGKQLWDLAQVGVGGTVGAYSWSSNVTLTSDNCKLTELLVDGKPVDMGKTYMVATSDFLAGGGSGVSRVNIPKDKISILWDEEFILRDITANVLKKWKKDLRAASFFSESAPRQKAIHKCEPPANSPPAPNAMLHEH